MKFLVNNHLDFKDVVVDKKCFSQLLYNKTSINTIDTLLYNEVNIDENDENLKYKPITNETMISDIIIDKSIIKEVRINDATYNNVTINNIMIKNPIINNATVYETTATNKAIVNEAMINKANNNALLIQIKFADLPSNIPIIDIYHA